MMHNVKLEIQEITSGKGSVWLKFSLDIVKLYGPLENLRLQIFIKNFTLPLYLPFYVF